MTYLKWGVRVLGVLIVCSSLILSALSIVGGAAFAAVNRAIYSTTGLKTQAVRQADDIQKLRSDLDADRSARRQLEGELADKVDELELRSNQVDLLQRNVASERLARETAQRQLDDAHLVERQIRQQLDDADRLTRMAQRNAFETSIDTVNGTMTIREVMGDTTRRIALQTETIGKRGVAGMAAEAVPYFGTAAIVGLTVMDLRDLCEMSRSSNDLYYAVFPDERPEETDPIVCGLNVPTRSEIWQMAKDAPGEAFQAAREATPTIEEIMSIESSDLWSFGVTVIGKSGELYESGVESAKLSWGSMLDLWNDWNK